MRYRFRADVRDADGEVWRLIEGYGASPREAFRDAWTSGNLNAKVGRIVEKELFADEQTDISRLRDSIDLAKDGKLWPR